MTERHGELTRYLTFKVDEYAAFLAPHLRSVLTEIAKEPEGITFEDLLMRVDYKGRWMGPRLLKALLKHLFDRDYIITNHQIAHLKIEHRIDAAKLRHKPYMTNIAYQRVKATYAKGR